MRLQALSCRTDEDDNLINEFMQLAHAYAALVRKEGIPLAPFHSPELPFFSKLEADKRREVIESLRLALEVFHSMASDGFSLRDSPKLMWRAASRMRLTPCPDVFDKIGSEDNVTIFSIENKILFYNMRFLEMHSFSLEELHCSAWQRLSRRTEWARDALQDVVTRMNRGEIQHTVDPGVPRHLVEEVSSGGKALVWVKVKYVSPVRRDGQPAGVIGVQEVTHALPTETF